PPPHRGSPAARPPPPPARSRPSPTPHRRRCRGPAARRRRRAGSPPCRPGSTPAPGSRSGLLGLLVPPVRRALLGHLDGGLLDRERERGLGLRRPDADALGPVALHQALADDVAQPLERSVAALGRAEGDRV